MTYEAKVSWHITYATKVSWHMTYEVKVSWHMTYEAKVSWHMTYEVKVSSHMTYEAKVSWHMTYATKVSWHMTYEVKVSWHMTYEAKVRWHMTIDICSIIYPHFVSIEYYWPLINILLLLLSPRSIKSNYQFNTNIPLQTKCNLGTSTILVFCGSGLSKLKVFKQCILVN
jgi:hypothetical protein